MAFASSFRRVLTGSSTILQSQFSPARFNSTVTSPKLFVSGTFRFFFVILCLIGEKTEELLLLQQLLQTLLCNRRYPTTTATALLDNSKKPVTIIAPIPTTTNLTVIFNTTFKFQYSIQTASLPLPPFAIRFVAVVAAAAQFVTATITIVIIA
ncbi:hypothetical protein CK203_024090 [Vitis vinifera]|uniref:Transmembrane protein n=1 Tax=Vitis vinifera TaxID=29760 RepID=A0A438IPV7_VITVI|nr:hypothetical protein CK203_024090 [Vitis vinifera]